jgi:hypothetical protein
MINQHQDDGDGAQAIDVRPVDSFGMSYDRTFFYS